ncbi:MAG: energy transducer TonB, partial [Bacteroidota bacterium]
MISTNSFAQKSEVNAEDATYKVVERMPIFGDCAQHKEAEAAQQCSQENLMKHLMTNLKYPEEAKKKGTEGRVIVSFVVDKKGAITKVEAKSELGDGCTEEALRVIKGMSNWTPGEQRGKKVNVQMYLPISFKL